MFRNVRVRPKGFNYTPRYYDPDKEDLEQRIRKIEKEVEFEKKEAEIAKTRLKQGFKRKLESRSNHSLVDKGRGKRLLIVLGLLLAVGRVLYRLLDF